MRDRHSHHEEVAIYGKWLCQNRGLSTATIHDYCRSIDNFFLYWQSRISPWPPSRLPILMTRWQRNTSREPGNDEHYRLRATSEAVLLVCRMARLVPSWACCRNHGAAVHADEAVPKGLKREDVLRLVASVRENRPAEKRDRAILTLFVAYGLRAGEVAGLRFGDLDWENEIIRVRCSKPGRTHAWPLTSDVGNAILSYIREVRPTAFGRHLFFTLNAPIRPVGTKTLGKIVRDRLAGVGVVTGRRGTQHYDTRQPSIFWIKACR